MRIVGNVLLVQGDTGSLDAIYSLLAENGINAKGNADAFVHEYGSFGVDEARDISARAATRAFGTSRRIFILVTPSITAEAQNAFLKTLEEPSGDALFLIVVPSPWQLLPTLRSRAQVVELGGVRKDTLVDAARFIKAAPAERLDMLKPLLDKDEDDKRDLSASIAFLAALEEKLSSAVQRNEDSLHAVYRARKYLGDKGSLSKALLEQVALLI